MLIHGGTGPGIITYPKAQPQKRKAKPKAKKSRKKAGV